MILQHTETGQRISISRNHYYKNMRNFLYWKDVTPVRTPKQVAASEKFVKLGKLYRTRANLQEVIRTFGPYHGIFTDAVNGLTNLIQENK